MAMLALCLTHTHTHTQIYTMSCVLNYVSFMLIKVSVRSPGDAGPESITDIIALYFLELFDWRSPGNSVANADRCQTSA